MRSAILCMIGLLGLTGWMQSVNAGDSVGRAIEASAIRDVAGKEVSLSSLAGKKATIAIFVGTQCPLVKTYGPRMIELEKRFAERGVSLILVNSNVQDSKEELADYVKQEKFTFPVLADRDGAWADAFAANRTPEAFLLDEKRVVRYQGRIDDQYGIGTVRPAATRADLAEAVEELLAGKTISKSHVPAIGCIIGRAPKPTSAGEAAVTYSNQIARIFQKRCVECHRDGEIAPFALTNYEEARGWAQTIAEVVRERRMPPWFASPAHGEFSNHTQMTDEERQQIATWTREGCPEGDPSKLPAPTKFVKGWGIGTPDKIYYMSDEPVHVPATGIMRYRHFRIDPKFTEDMWVCASEARPSAPGVVHHILVFGIPPGSSTGNEFINGRLIGAYAPGVPAHPLDKGQAVFLPKGTQIMMQIHYTTNGRAQDDMSMLGLKFVKKEQVKQRVESSMVINYMLMIPPGSENYKVQAFAKIFSDQYLLTLTPHMHLRGKSFRYEATYPDGKKEILLDVPRYDFNWQITYRLAQPKFLPKGTELRGFAVYDNSAKNVSNPDPKTWVRFGDQTFDEMMIGWYTIAYAGSPEPPRVSKGIAGR